MDLHSTHKKSKLFNRVGILRPSLYGPTYLSKFISCFFTKLTTSSLFLYLLPMHTLLSSHSELYSLILQLPKTLRVPGFCSCLLRYNGSSTTLANTYYLPRHSSNITFFPTLACKDSTFCSSVTAFIMIMNSPSYLPDC